MALSPVIIPVTDAHIESLIDDAIEDASFTPTGRNEVALYDDFSGHADGALSGQLPLTGSAWSTTGAQPTIVSTGRATSTGTGYMVQSFTDTPTVMMCDVSFSGANPDTATMTMSWARVSGGSMLNDLVHLNFGPSVFTLTVRKDAGTFDPILSGTWKAPMAMDGTVYRIMFAMTGENVTVYGPNGGVWGTSDRRIRDLLASGGKTVFWEPTTTGGNQAFVHTVAVVTTTTTGENEAGIQAYDVSALSHLMGAAGQVYGNHYGGGEVRIGLSPTSNLPSITFGPTEVRTYLTAASIIGATTFTVKDIIPPNATLQIGYGTTGETLTQDTHFSSGTGPFVSTTTGAATKAHAIGAPVTATIPSGDRCEMFFNAEAGFFYLPDKLTVVQNTAGLYFTSNLDTNLYRGSANFLKTDDQFQAEGGLITKTKAGVPSDADTAVDADGSFIQDTTNHRLYMRSGGIWRFVQLQSVVGSTDYPAFRVKDYGGVSDGNLTAGTGTNNRVAAIATMTAIEVAIDAGLIPGARIYFDPGVWRMEHTGGSAGPQSMYNICPITRSHVTVELAEGAVIMLRTGHTDNVQVFGAHGWSNPSGPSAWLDHWISSPGSTTAHPVYPCSPIAKGATTITMTNSGDAALFAAATRLNPMAIHIRAGQTLAIQGTTANEPDAELNQVVNRSGNVLTLKKPTKKAYVQEYFATAPGAGVGPTTTTSSAYPALFGVQIVETAVLRDIKVVGGRFDLRPATGRAFGFYPVQVIGWEISSQFDGENAAMQNGGTHSEGRVHDVLWTHNFTTAADAFFSANTGCSDFILKNAEFVSTNPTYPILLHTHEGVADVHLENVQILNPATATNNHAWQMIGRGYDFSADDLVIWHVTSGGGAPIYSDSTIIGVTLDNLEAHGNALALDGDKIKIGKTNACAINILGRVTSEQYTISKWVYHTSPTNMDVTSFPANTIVTAVELELFTPFNTAATLKAAKKGGYDQWFMNSKLLNGSAGPQAIVREPTTCYYQQGSAPTVELQFAAASASAGKARFTVTWTYCELGSGI